MVGTDNVEVGTVSRFIKVRPDNSYGHSALSQSFL